MPEETNPINITKELEEKATILLLMPGASYNTVVIDTARKVSGKRVCYITLNKTYNSLQELFFKQNINTRNFFFIDAISKSFTEQASEQSQCQFITPGSLTEISLTIAEVLKTKFDYFIFDSVTNLFVYQRQNDVIKFLSDMLQKVKRAETKAVLYAVEEEDTLLRKLCVMVDACITVPRSNP